MRIQAVSRNAHKEIMDIREFDTSVFIASKVRVMCDMALDEFMNTGNLMQGWTLEFRLAPEKK